jgi:Flp pilus assembly protein TadB
MKIILTNEEWSRASWFHRLVAGNIASIVLLLILAGLILLVLFFVHVLTLIPLNLYLAAIVVLLLIVVFRKRSTRS